MKRKAQDNDTVTVPPKVFEQALKNPLKGFRPRTWNIKNHPMIHQLLILKGCAWDCKLLAKQ